MDGPTGEVRYFLSDRSIAHATDETWPSCYPVAIVSRVSAWRVALFSDRQNASLACWALNAGVADRTDETAR